MLECGACASRVIRALVTDSAVLRSRQRLFLTPHLLRRAASTDVAPGHHGGEPYLNAAQIRHHATRDNDDFVKFDLRPSAPKRGKANVETEEKTLSEAELRAVKKELLYLPDPVKLAEHVHYILRCEQPEKALALCRMASKDMNCVVSWNHVVDWYMKRGKVNEALKVYNEMKKRAQFPDSYTYVLLLRGLLGSQRQDKKTSVSQENVTKAVSLYHSMKSPTSRVEPSIIHTNAALQVCAFGQDMDAFWGIASKIPEVGHGAADHRTYSIILNALRHEAENNTRGQDAVQASIIRRKAANEGRRIWLEVIQKWRNGAIIVDEDLVCSMARVLLASDRLQDWDDVLNLFRQTMNIERMLAPLGSADRHTAHVPHGATDGEQSSELSVSTRDVDDDGYRDTPAGQAFKRLNLAAAPQAKSNIPPPSQAYVQPGNDSLSVLLEACGKMRSQRSGMAYWKLLTSEYGVKPDLQNLHSQILLLKYNRASARVAELLKSEILHAKLQPKHLTFRLALEACARDIKNPNVLNNATSMIDVMEQTLVEVDLETLHKYLDLAEGTGDDAAALIKVLNRLDSILHSLRSRILYGTDGPVDQAADREYCSRALAFMHRVKGLMHKLVAHELVPEESVSHWKARRAHLDAFLDRNHKFMKGKVKQGIEDHEKGGDNRPQRMGRQVTRAASVAREHGSNHPSRSGWLNRSNDVESRQRREKHTTGFADSPADLPM